MTVYKAYKVDNVDKIFIPVSSGDTGAFRVVPLLANLTDGTIPLDQRQQGMRVHVIATGLDYQLNADLTTWATISYGAAVAITAVKTSSYTAVANDLVRADPSAGAFNVTLPAATTSGATITVKNISLSASLVTILFTGGDTSDGDASVDIPSGVAVTFVADGTSNWMRV